MSKHDWKPGDVAMVTSRKGGPCVSLRTNSHTWRCQHGSTIDENVIDAHPLAVIDPARREQVERLTRGVIGFDLDMGVDQMQAALREFANPKPPRPDEPQGLGAVVEAINDNRFTRVGNAGWVHEQDMAGEPCDWEDIAFVRVLSEGVQP